MSPIQRIILVDDNEPDNVFHSIIIRGAGFDGDLRVFEDGVSGLEYLRNADLQVPTLIFLDINMPGMDGFEFAEQATPLISQDHASAIIMMLTSSRSPHDIEKAKRLAVIRDFLTKPLQVDQVREILADPPDPKAPAS